jgi:hypothetical protein
VASGPPVSVIETDEFVRVAAQLMNDRETAALIEYVANNPLAGAVIPSSGGLRKLRWALSGRGKRGGARAVYYFHHATKPIMMFGLYAKNVKADLEPAELRRLRAAVEALKREFRS